MSLATWTTTSLEEDASSCVMSASFPTWSSLTSLSVIVVMSTKADRLGTIESIKRIELISRQTINLHCKIKNVCMNECMNVLFMHICIPW